ncbi:Lysophosphatidic acid phosphatase type 6 [Astathelohania contejeani]|uniref:Lysophosphatidic acid phosphatase type 6 n=1 Tax=Astathelohania contejeani TaxID=164912 RepID=A0ABQ7I2W4_9MICR|nr:Lysophosphatidic acid phosphatase type 6 [Thelohania contejeani]
MKNGLQLVQVNILHRHGERSSIYTLKDNIVSFNSCQKQNKIFHELPTKAFLPAHRFQIINSDMKSGHCAPGQLTDKGKRNLFGLGRQIISEYKTLIGDKYDNKSITFKTTNYPRTIESVQSLIKGMFPHPINSFKISVIQDSEADSAFVKERTEWRTKMVNKNASLLDQINKYFKEKYNCNVRSIYQAFDIIRAAGGDDQNIFSDFPKNLLGKMEKYSLELFFGNLRKKRNLDVYMRDTFNIITGWLKDKTSKVNVLSCHDTTIYPLLMVLDIEDGKWPRFGANIIIEKYLAPDKREYVRLKYDGVVKPILKAGKYFDMDREYCELNSFLNIIK